MLFTEGDLYIMALILTRDVNIENNNIAPATY
jgi:hypothetical protein